MYAARRVLTHEAARAEVAAHGALVASHFRTLQPMRTLLDGIRSEDVPGQVAGPIGGASLANDPHGVAGAAANTRFLLLTHAAAYERYFAPRPPGAARAPLIVDGAGEVRVCLEATRDIAAGDEIYVSYGADYWSRR